MQRRRPLAVPIPPCTRAIALGLTIGVAPACGFEESNALDLPRVQGSPVELRNVRMAESLFASLGAAPTKLSSSDGPNAIGIAYDVHVVDAAAPYSGVSAQLACRVGEHTVLSRLATDASGQLAAAAEGSTLEGRETFPPTPFSSEIPSVCETTLYYTIAPPLASVPAIGDDAPASPGPVLQPLGTVCFSGGELVEGACPAEVLPRTPATTPLEVSRLSGRIGDLAGAPDGAVRHGLGVTLLVTAGEGVPASFHLGAEATCGLGTGTRTIPIPLFMFGRDLAPGESIVHSAATSAREGLPSAPEWCTVDVQLAEGGGKRSLARFCVRGDATTEGACAS
jgi:hypothetical protein